MKKIPWIRTVYLYLMTTIGIVVFIIGAVTILNLLLKIFIFTQADADYYSKVGPTPIILEREIGQAQAVKDCDELTEGDKEQISAWLVNYQEQQAEEAAIERKRAQRERDAARSLAMILVGLPVWLFHWRIIQRDRKREEA